MGKVVGAISLSLVLASAGAAWSQNIGTVTALPNAVTGEVSADTTAQPDGETVYIVRDGALISQATVKSSGGQGGTVLSLPAGTSAAVKVGDRISLAAPAGTSVVTTTKTTKVTTEVGAPEPAAVAMSVPGPVPPPAPTGTGQLDKTAAKFSRASIQPVMAESTPRGMGVPLYPAPAKVSTEAGIMAPYGQGLAAAAPVGTPYLRSPAFAGPPVIYMPQTVTRVLLPGATPYPSNIMSPPANYTYASAPFLRTDIYTSLPYGTFYWPQGYAGTTPVEPQVPAYVTAPASAVLSTEADYSAGRYAPGLANEETLNPITAGINSNLVASSTVSADGAVAAATVSAVPQVDTVPSLTITQPDADLAPAAVVGTPATVNPFPVLSDTASDSTTVTPDPTAGLAPLPTVSVPTPAPAVPTPAPAAPTPAAGLPELPPAIAPEAPGLPDLPAQSAQQSATTSAATLPNLPAAPATQVAAAGLPTLPASTPASMSPSLPQTETAPATQIVVDDKTPGGLTTAPEGAWMPSASTESYGDSSLIANVEPGVAKTATFNATIPADGLYRVELAFVGAPQFRADAVPVTITTATGPQQIKVDQTQPGQWHSLGNFQLKAGQNVPVVTLTTEGLDGAGSNVSVSADAVRLTPTS